MELKPRQDMDPQYQWDLSPIYKDQAAWEAAYAASEAALPRIADLSGKLSGPAALKEALDEYYAQAERIERVYAYAMLQKAGDNGDGAYQAMEDRATRLYVAFEAAASFLTPEILALPRQTLDGCRAAAPGYAHLLSDIERGRAHTLDAAREGLLARLADAAGTPDRAFTMLESVDMAFPSITGQDGQPAELTHGKYRTYLESPDRRVRKQAYETYFGEFKRYINTFAATYGGSVKYDVFSAQARNYDSSLSAALFAGNIPESVYTSLIGAVHEKLPAMGDYLKLRKRSLGLSELHMYDLYCPMVPEAEIKLSFSECTALVKQALSPLGEDYGKLLDTAFQGRWMDVYENRGKTTGAFSCGVYGVHPYVLLNFAGTLDDAFTIAHELGHAMHSYLSDAAQDYANHDYKIMVAEVASTVNEVLLLKFLLNREKDPRRRAYLLNHFLEGFRTTLFRQTLFAEFELETHRMEEAGEPLTAQSMNALYQRLNEEYYGVCAIDELQRIEWARIPHFYNAFYVYQYATGYASAVAIASRILETGDPSGYLRFLSTGGSDYPLEELKTAGIDLARPETVREALEVFEAAIKELDELIK